MREKICLFEMDEFLLIVEFETWGEGDEFLGEWYSPAKQFACVNAVAAS